MADEVQERTAASPDQSQSAKLTTASANSSSEQSHFSNGGSSQSMPTSARSHSSAPAAGHPDAVHSASTARTLASVPEGGAPRVASHAAAAEASATAMSAPREPWTLPELLAHMHEHEIPFLQRYTVGSPAQQTIGSNSVVQRMARAHDALPVSAEVR